MPRHTAEHYFKELGTRAAYGLSDTAITLVVQHRDRPEVFVRARDRRGRDPYLLLLIYLNTVVNHWTTGPGCALQVSGDQYHRIESFIHRAFGHPLPVPPLGLRLVP